ncbi:MAG TPA: RHS repeat-associated core domain-containing protein, partial [Candidatus Dormibacteraeota bacterium]
NGNRTQSGSHTFSYDARDQLTSDGTSSYSYTARGTLASVSGPGGTAAFSSDAFGQAITQAGQTYAYDALGRAVTDTGAAGTTAFSYSGTSTTLASDGTSTYTWDPSGTSLAGIGVAGGPQSAGVLALTDGHTDVVGQFTASGTSLSGSATYDPLGNVTTSAGMAGRLGYQSAWTDTANGRVNMNSRWYSPAAGQFTSRDTAAVSPVPDSAAANPFAYAADNPLTGTDPTGHMRVQLPPGGYVVWRPSPPPAQSCPWYNPVCYVVHAAAHVWHAATSAYHHVVHFVSSVARNPWYYMNQLRRFASTAIHYAGHTITTAVSRVADYASVGIHVAAVAWHATVSAGVRAVHHVAHWASAGYHAVTHAVHTAVHAVARAATATVNYVKHHAAAITSFVVSAAVFMGCEAVVTGVSGGALTVPGAIACGALAGAAGNAVSYGITAAQTGKFSLTGLVTSVAGGAVIGGLSMGLLKGLGPVAARGLSAALGGASRFLSSSASSAAAGAVADSTAAASSTAVSAVSDAAAAGAENGGSAAGNAARSCLVNSFSGNTKVLLPGSKTIAISKVKAGQKVLATDPYTGTTAARQVAQVIKHHGVHAMALIALLGGGLIHATAHHPIYDASTKAFTYAADLHPGDKLLEPDGSTIKITSVRDYTADLTAYNLDVTGIHTYYALAGTVPVLVHNSCGDVLFGQRRIGPTFSREGVFKGRSIYAVAQDLRNGALDPNGIKINAFWHEGQLVAENNRSLAALSLAGLKPTNINILDSASRDTLGRLGQDALVGDGLPSRMTAVTPSQEDLRVGDIIHLPGG